MPTSGALMNNRTKFLLIAVLAGTMLPGLSRGGEPKAFVHPGLLHTRADLDRMKVMVTQGVEPWKSGFEHLEGHPQSRSDWRLRRPLSLRYPGGRRASLHINEMDQDANAAYQNALMWCITGKEAHAKKSMEILNAWSAKLEEIVGKDKELAASLGGFKFVNAAEIISATPTRAGQAQIGSDASGCSRTSSTRSSRILPPLPTATGTPAA